MTTTNTPDPNRNRLHFLVHCTEQYTGDPSPGIVRRAAVRKEGMASGDVGDIFRVEAGKYLAAANECVAAGLPRPGVHLRYPCGIANGKTPAIESMVDGEFGSSRFANNPRHDVFQVCFAPPWRISEVSAYIGGVPEERTWASRGVKELESTNDATARHLGAIWPGMSFVAIDVAGVAEPGSWGEYAVLRFQKLGVNVAPEPVREGTWKHRPPLPVFMEARVFANHSTRPSDRALFRRVMAAPRVIVMDDGTMPDFKMASWFLSSPNIEFVLPPERFTPALLKLLPGAIGKAGGAV